LTNADGAKISVKKSPLTITVFDASGEKVLADAGRGAVRQKFRRNGGDEIARVRI
jgi:hypothetical protein